MRWTATSRNSERTSATTGERRGKAVERSRGRKAELHGCSTCTIRSSDFPPKGFQCILHLLPCSLVWDLPAIERQGDVMQRFGTGSEELKPGGEGAASGSKHLAVQTLRDVKALSHVSLPNTGRGRETPHPGQRSAAPVPAGGRAMVAPSPDTARTELPCPKLRSCLVRVVIVPPTCEQGGEA